MTKSEIIGALAASRKVEDICRNIAHTKSMSADLLDLAQCVYLILLEYDETKVRDMYQAGTLNFFLVRIVINQYRSRTSPFHKQFREFRRLCEEYSPADYNAEQVEAAMKLGR